MASLQGLSRTGTLIVTGILSSGIVAESLAAHFPLPSPLSLHSAFQRQNIKNDQY